MSEPIASGAWKAPTAAAQTAARCGGGCDAEVTHLVSGVDFYERLVDVAIGKQPDYFHRRPTTQPAAMVRFLAPPRGIVKAIDGIADVTWRDGIVEAVLDVRPGDELVGLVNGASRIGHILAFGASREEVVARSRARGSCIIK